MTGVLTDGQVETGSDAPQDAAETIVAAASEAMLITDGESRSGFLNDAICRLIGSDRRRLGFVRLIALVNGMIQRTTSDRSFRSHIELLGNDRQSAHASVLRMRGVTPRSFSITSQPIDPQGRRQLWIVREDRQLSRQAMDCRSCAGEARSIHDALLARTRALSEARDLADASRVVAEQASRAKSEFMAHLSHELRTPLNAVLGFSEVISRELLGPSAVPAYVDYARSIHQSGTTLLGLIDDILDLSQVETGRVAVRLRPMDLGELVTGLELDEDLRPGVRLATDLPQGRIVIPGDPDILARAVLHLVEVSANVAPAGSTVTIRAFDTGTHAGIEVIDAGSVMSAVEIENALAAFGDTDSQIARSGRGRGVGLSLADALIRLHGGRLVIAPRGNGGMVTRVLLPRG